MKQYPHFSISLQKLFILSLIALMLIATNAAAAPPRNILAQVGDEERSLDLILLIDESGSTWGRTDPEPDPASPGKGLPPFRIRAAQLLVNLLAVEQGRANPDHRVAVYFFGTEVAEVVPLQPIAGQAFTITEKIQRAHYTLGNLKWTDTAAAFSKAKNVLSALPSDPGRRAVVVMITDGRPETKDANTQDGDNSAAAQKVGAYLEQNTAVIQSINSVPNSTSNCKAIPTAKPAYLLAVDVEANTAYQGTRYVQPEFPNYWSQDNVLGKQYRPVKDFEALSGQVSLLVAELLCAVGTPPTAPITVPTSKSFDVRQNYVSVIFTTINSNPNTRTTITPPGGTPLTATSPGVKVEQSSGNQVWSVNRDKFSGTWAGPWEVKVEGQGTVQFSFIQFSDSYAVRLLQPVADLHPAGKPLDVVGQVINSSNELYTQPTQSFMLNAARTASDGSQSPIDMQMARNNDASYQARIERPKPGRYALNLTADLGNNEVAQLAPARTIAVEKLPYPVLVEPRSGTPLFANGKFAVSISARSMGENDDQPHPIDEIVARRTKILATLRNPSDGSKLEEVSLTVQTDSNGVTHVAQLPSPKTPGTYELVIHLEYPLKDQVFTDTFTQTLNFQAAQPTAVTPTIEVPPTPSPTIIVPSVTPVPPPPPAGDPLPAILVTLAIAAVGGGGLWWWLTAGRMGKLDGTWLDAPDGPVNLRGGSHKLTLLDRSGLKQGQVKLSRDKSGQVMAEIVRLESGQNLTCAGQSLAQGDMVPLNNGDSLNLDGRDWTFNQ